MKRIFSIAILIGIALRSPAPPLFGPPNSWVDQKFASMTPDERIAQLMMIEVRPSYGVQHLNQVRVTVRTHQVGGVIFFKGDPLEEVKLTNELQSLSKIPMLVAIDGEWGLAMRLKNTVSYPYQMGLGSIQDNEIIYQMGRQIGRDCRRMGIHVNFAPVIDINNNPNNPVINYRSFGEDKYNVAAKGWAYSKGMQDEQVIACAKHFPGHGDTDVDSHKDLPVINHNRKRLDTLEMYPFRALIDSGVLSVMTAHLYIPSIDNQKNAAISISEKAINGILRKELKFNGLAFTDALNMQGVAKFHQPGELEVKALEAGNDILLGPENVAKAIQMIKEAIKSGRLKQEYVDEKVKKVLLAKYWAGLNKYEPVKEYGLLEDLNNGYSAYLLNTLIEKQLCAVRNRRQYLPIDVTEPVKIATLAIGSEKLTVFQETVNHYADADHFTLGSNTQATEQSRVFKLLSDYDLVIASLHGTSKFPSGNYGLSATDIALVKKVTSSYPCIFVDFGNPYNLKYFPDLHTLVLGFEDGDIHQQKAAQALFGALPVNGRLSVSVGTYKVGEGEDIPALPILQVAIPEEVGMNTEILKDIDNIANKAIAHGATPGCQVLVARYGKIIWNKGYGYHTYDNKEKVETSDLYDLASITKIAATTIATMKLVEEGRLKLDDRLSKYLKDLDTTNKKHVTVREVLTHSAGLKDWIPFYKASVSDPVAYDTIYSKVPDDRFCIKVDDNLYMCKEYQEVIFGSIYSSELKNEGEYRYSDLGMILMRFLIEEITGTPFDRYLDSVFYQPMGLRYLTFKPLEKFGKDQIVPTERDADFRKGVIHGYVHDPSAAMLGGVSGHAGLFSNASDLAALMQMLLNGGLYNGYRFLKPETISLFTAYQERGSRRGLGFDKPEPDKRKINPASSYASGKTFGHSGFTGTQVWADPQYGLIYVFLSNRVHPTANNKLLVRDGVRTEIMNVIYESMKNENLAKNN
ncbi:MAG: serine hydrolase [Flavobacteriales bacterium]|nr:serine hydrolase [Flavobacteriales bacterium]